MPYDVNELIVNRH